VALGLGVVISSLCGVAAWFLLPPPKFVAQTTLQVRSATPRVLFETSDSVAESPDAYQRYQKNQIAQLKSRLVMSTALGQPGISKLRIVSNEQDPIDWLLTNLQAQFLQGSDLLQISMEGNEPEEQARLVNAVAKAYMDEVVTKDLKLRVDRQELLKKFSKQYAEMIKTKRETLRTLAQRAGSDDRATLALKQQYHLELLSSVRRELRETQSRKRRLEAMIKAQRPEALHETAAATLSSDAVERLIGQDPEVSTLRARVSELESALATETARTGRVARNATLNPALKALHDEIDATMKQLERRRRLVRPSVLRQLQDLQSDDSGPRGNQLERQLTVEDQLEANLKEELKNLSKKDQDLTENTLDLQEMQDDLRQLQDVLIKTTSEIEKLNVELQAPPRIKIFEEATTPSQRDSKRWNIMFAMATLGSFLATLLGTALLELRTQKVDTVEEVTADLGLPVVGSLPMLPSRARRSGSLAVLPKDRYWYNLLLESIDATRTMLIHAAGTGSHRVVMITSALPGEGKTSLASHLATSLARSGKKTLLIDADMRKPSIHRLFELSLAPGLGELLRGDAAFEDVVASSGIPELKIVTAGASDQQTMKILSQGGIGNLFDQLREHFDFMIVDTSPILPVADALLISQQADAVLFSILTDVSRKTKIFAAYQRLATLGANVLGAVVTGAHDGVYGSKYYAALLDHAQGENSGVNERSEPTS
jgi:capsular exopolysaccharide synthesis family protein